MKQASLVFSILAFIGVLILFGMQMKHSKQAAPAATVTPVNTAAPAAGGGRIAYVDIDSLEAHYESLKARREDFSRRQEAMEHELQRSAQQMQSDYTDIQRRAQSGSMSQAEQETAAKRLSQMQQSLETRKQTMSEQLQKELESFNQNLQLQLDSFLEDYNKDKRYDFILSYAHSGSILYANKALNITPDVIKGMNERSNPGKK